MIIDLYAIKDELNGFTSPIPFMKEEMAKRYLKDQYMSNPTISNSPKDFSIWLIGTYDTDEGKISGGNKGKMPVLIERAENYAG